MTQTFTDHDEWLEADGQGGFASGTVSGIRTRRYQALLLVAMTPPTSRVVLVNGLEAWIETPAGRAALTSQRYTPGVVYPDGAAHITAFRRAPWPSWEFSLPDGTSITQEIFVAPESGQTVLRWRRAGPVPCRLFVRLLLSGRDAGALHQENPAFPFAATVQDGTVRFQPYPGLPGVTAHGAFTWEAAPEWYRHFLYTVEQDRGLDCVEDLASPGILSWDLASEATLVLRADDAPPHPVAALIRAEQARRAQPSLRLAADSYLSARGSGRTVLAGFPWFTDWGRDTFISLRGLLLSQGHMAEATEILLAWAGMVDQGMVPNRFPDGAGPPEFNAVDASLWFVVAVHALLAAGPVPPVTVQRLHDAAESILAGYAAGTRFGIAADADGLLRAGVPGVQLTWMDAKVGDWVVTPRIGKPVEVQALWINALRIADGWSPGRWGKLAVQATASLLARFPDPETGGLYDVVDADHQPGAVNRQIRPNQIFAVGGLPFPLLPDALARSVVALVERELLTPLGLRTLAPADPAYRPRYRGDRVERDGAYHQGTVWPWLIGPFVEAWLRARGDSAEARAETRVRFLPPLYAHLETGGLGHITECADGDAPHTPGGCPFQAWSLAELLRIEALL